MISGTVSGELQSATRPRPCAAVRTLQIEADGDFCKGLIKPKIRIMGRWLEQAGFKPGDRVRVLCVAPGIIELRAHDAVDLSAWQLPPVPPPDEPF
jgi:hypothetical protein